MATVTGVQERGVTHYCEGSDGDPSDVNRYAHLRAADEAPPIIRETVPQPPIAVCQALVEGFKRLDVAKAHEAGHAAVDFVASLVEVPVPEQQAMVVHAETV